MGRVVFGIYGYDFCRRGTVADIELVPIYNYPESRKKAEARTELALTGYGVIQTHIQRDGADLVQCLADGMTFCQQQLVLPTILIEISAGDSIEALIASGRLPAVLPIFSDRHTSGPAVASDAVFPASRIDFLRQFMDLLAETGDDHPLRAAIYHQIQIWKLSQPFVELEHFLAFSGLEILARSYGPDPNSTNVAIPMSGMLRDLGFAVPQTLAQEWATARNGLFHRGKLDSPMKDSRKIVRILDQLFALSTLLADASLRKMGFDDGHINWRRWEDRQPFC